MLLTGRYARSLLLYQLAENLAYNAQAFQSDSAELARKVAASILNLHEISPSVVFEVFVHKIDGMSEDYQGGTFFSHELVWSL